ncbi:Hypothetical predicted protein, partial [Prunus dulcis]
EWESGLSAESSGIAYVQFGPSLLTRMGVQAELGGHTAFGFRMEPIKHVAGVNCLTSWN